MQQFPSNPRLDEMRDKVMAAASGLNRGDTLTHDAIEQAAGIVRYSEHWNALIRKVMRAMLDERRVVLLSVRTVGYKLLTLHEQVNVPSDKRQRKASRQLSRAIVETARTPREQLGLHDASVRAVRLAYMGSYWRALGRSRRAQAAFGRTETLPKRPRPQAAG